MSLHLVGCATCNPSCIFDRLMLAANPGEYSKAVCAALEYFSEFKGRLSVRHLSVFFNAHVVNNAPCVVQDDCDFIVDAQVDGLVGFIGIGFGTSGCVCLQLLAERVEVVAVHVEDFCIIFTGLGSIKYTGSCFQIVAFFVAQSDCECGCAVDFCKRYKEASAEKRVGLCLEVFFVLALPLIDSFVDSCVIGYV